MRKILTGGGIGPGFKKLTLTRTLSFAGAVLTLPTRELALIGTYDVPKTKQSGAFKMDVCFYLDRKNKPSEKTGIIAVGDANIDKNSLSISGEVKFVYPSQPKVHIRTTGISK